MGSAYTPAQITKYLQYIALPNTYEAHLNDPESFPKTEEALKDLFRCQITRFPYDNLTCHYSTSQLAEIHPERIYTKVIGCNDTAPTCRGGYCLEVSIFFHHMLRGLGFSVYMTGVRNRQRIDGIPQGEFKGWWVSSAYQVTKGTSAKETRTHIVNIVRLPSGKEYHLDAAFGGDGPLSPLPLVSGQVTQNLGLQEVRLIYDNMPKQMRREQKMWIYQYRNGADRPWNSFYAFAELEWFQDDFEVVNRFTSWDAVQKGSYVVVKFVRSGETEGLPLIEGEGEGANEEVCVVGKIMMVNNLIKLNMGGRTRVIDSYEDDEGRFKALKKWFSISL
jgi:arylamine N-acetyltransferase